MGFLADLFGVGDINRDVTQRKRDQQGDRSAARDHQSRSGSSPASESEFDDAWSQAAADYTDDGGKFHK